MKYQSELLSFLKKYESEANCRKLLFDLKWKNGYSCRRCGCKSSMKGKTQFHKRCRKCHYDESCTAHTLFHKLKFPLNKAFAIIFQIATIKKGLSNCEIARQFHIQRETAWFFRKRVRIAIASELKHESIHDFSHLLQLLNNTRAEPTHARDLAFGVRKKTKISITRNKTNHSRKAHPFGDRFLKSLSIQSSEPKHASNHYLLLLKLIHFENRGRRKLHFIDISNHQVSSIWPQFDTINLKNWLVGIHHKASIEHLSGYFNEFLYRLKNRFRIFHLPLRLIRRFMDLPKAPYISLIAP